MNYLVGEVNGQGHFQTFRNICDSSEIWAKRKGSKELGDAQARPMIRGYGGARVPEIMDPVCGWKRGEGRVYAQERYRGGKRLTRRAKGRAFKKRRERESDRNRERKLSVDRSGDPSA